MRVRQEPNPDFTWITPPYGSDRQGEPIYDQWGNPIPKPPPGPSPMPTPTPTPTPNPAPAPNPAPTPVPGGTTNDTFPYTPGQSSNQMLAWINWLRQHVPELQQGWQDYGPGGQPALPTWQDPNIGNLTELMGRVSSSPQYQTRLPSSYMVNQMAQPALNEQAAQTGRMMRDMGRQSREMGGPQALTALRQQALAQYGNTAAGVVQGAQGQLFQEESLRNRSALEAALSGTSQQWNAQYAGAMTRYQTDVQSASAERLQRQSLGAQERQNWFQNLMALYNQYFAALEAQHSGINTGGGVA
jgi:hypothetical protein